MTINEQLAVVDGWQFAPCREASYDHWHRGEIGHHSARPPDYENDLNKLFSLLNKVMATPEYVISIHEMDGKTTIVVYNEEKELQGSGHNLDAALVNAILEAVK